MEQEGVLMPVERQGAVLGYVQSAPRQGRAGASLEEAFAARQLKNMLWIGGVALVLAVLIAAWMTRRVLAPLRLLMAHVDRLTQGDYSPVRISPRRDEFGELLHNVSRLAATLEQTRAARRRMFANVSHELRTPLTILTAEIEAIEDGVRPLDARALESFEQEVSRLRHLVDDVYELSTSQMGAMIYVFERQDLCALIARELEAMEVHRLDGIELTTQLETCVVRMDPRRIAQLARNLISNAVTYTDLPGRVHISLTSDGFHATLCVSDSSPSVHIEECAHLVEPLYRVEGSHLRSKSGAGLGLAICANIVDAHGGTLTISPSELGGISVVVKLPVK